MENAGSNDAIESSKARMSCMKQMLAALTKSFRQQPLPPPPLPIQVEPDNNDIINLTQKFMKMKPPTFFGGIEPLKAETWLLKMEKFNGNTTWAQFNEIFYDKYFPQCFRDQKVSEFQELKQGKMYVAEYEAKFTELARFAPYMVDTDYKKARKFEGGFDLDVFDQVGVLKLATYVELLDRALIAEATLAAMKQTKAPITEWRSKRPGSNFRKGRSSFTNKKQNTRSSSSSSQSNGSMPVCSECGRKHKGTCYRASGTFFRCGKTGHMIRDCPMRFDNVASSAGSTPTQRTNVRTNTGKEPLRQGRVFALVPSVV
ncbi:uncharacterized protein LOC114289466 [Camellia sinensis]|uniref:uncharacterized protein LOC114289466 n=1 Tax=Camellia sinensis TaxID=4442 RepID=UPI001035A1E7|nr:uncharacterized protein LOC114289466 [Camellia sinensis]